MQVRLLTPSSRFTTTGSTAESACLLDWLADLCEEKRIPFVLGHALAMKHIHGGKALNCLCATQAAPKVVRQHVTSTAARR